MTFTNRDRIDHGRAACMAGTAGRYEDRQEQLVDALANIMHYAAANHDTDFKAAVQSAATHFTNETGD